MKNAFNAMRKLVQWTAPCLFLLNPPAFCRDAHPAIHTADEMHAVKEAPGTPRVTAWATAAAY